MADQRGDASEAAEREVRAELAELQKRVDAARARARSRSNFFHQRENTLTQQIIDLERSAQGELELLNETRAERDEFEDLVDFLEDATEAQKARIDEFRKR